MEEGQRFRMLVQLTQGVYSKQMLVAAKICPAANLSPPAYQNHDKREKDMKNEIIELY